MKKLLNDYDNVQQECFLKIENFDTEIISHKERVNKYKTNYIKSVKEVEENLFSCEEAKTSSIDKYYKSNYQLQLNLKNLIDMEQNYKTYINYANQQIQQLSSNISNFIQVIQNKEEIRINSIKDGLQRILIFEAELSQNIKYDMNTFTNSANKINATQDLESLLIPYKKTIKHKKYLFELERVKSGWEKLFQVYEKNYYNTNKAFDYIKIVEVTKTNIMREDDKEFKNYYRKLFDLCTILIEKDPIPKECFPETLSLITSKKGRISFIEAITKYREEKKSLIANKGFQNIFEIVMKYLDLTIENEELISIHEFILLMKGYKGMSKENTIMNLLDLLKSHSIWKNIKYWESLIGNEIENSIRILRGSIPYNEKAQSLSENFSKEKEEIVMILKNFVSYLVEFDNKIEEAFKLIHKFSNLNHLNRGLVDELDEYIRKVFESKEHKIEKTPTKELSKSE